MYDAHSKEESNLLSIQTIWVQATYDDRWSYCVVKSKVEMTQLYVVQTPQGQYCRNRPQLREAAIPTTVPVSTSSANTTTSTTVQPTSVPLYTKDVPTQTICPINELPDNNNRVSNVSAEWIPDPPNCKGGGN